MKTNMSNLWKQLLVIFTVVMAHSAFAQAPQKMSYQAVIRDNTNQLIANTAIGMQVSILQGSASGTAVYVETHTPTTNQNGLTTVELGSGTQVSGDFTTIDWSTGDYFIKIETDPTGGIAYTITGTSQLLSVPYAFYAESTNETDPTVGSVAANKVPTWNGTTLVDGSIQDDATNIGVGTAPVVGNKLTVNGRTATTNLQLTNGASANYVLQSDASGNATWVNPTTLPVTETDPQVSATTFQAVPRWNGTALVDGAIRDDATNVGIGALPVPGNRLTVAGKTTTTDIQIVNGATANYVLKSDASGNGTWVNPSTLAITETDPQVSSITTNRIPKWNGTTLADGLITDNGTNVGVGIPVPADKLHVVGNTRVDGGRIDFRNTGNSIRIGENAGLNDDLNDNSNVFIGTDAGHASIDGSDNVAIGQGALESTLSSNNVAVGRGSFNNNVDGFDNVGLGLNSGYFNNSDNNIFLGSHAGYNNVGTANIFIGAYAGYYETASDKLYIHNSDVTDPLIYGDFVERDLTFNGSVGIDTAPDAANKLTVNGNTATTNFQMTNGANANYVLQSDASGNATWVNPTTLAVTESDPQVSSATSTSIPRWNGTSLVDGIIRDDATNVGIGTAPVAANKLTVAGKTATTNLQMTNGATANYVLRSDASGNATWVNPTTLAVTENDPQVSSATANKIPKWNGSTMVDGQVTDNGTNIGIGTTTPGWFTTVRNDDNLFSSANVVDESKFALVVLSQSGTDGDGVGIGLGNNTGGNQAGAGIVFKKTGTNSLGDLMLTVKEDGTSSGPQFPAMTIKSMSGNVGIGTTSPSQAKLVINGSANSNVGGYGYLNSSGSTGTSTGVWSYSIYASHRIAALEFNAFSDARIKKVKGVSDSKTDLAILSTIKITDYQLIDSIAKGNKMIKKVIAQELEQVYPQAVSTHTDVIPDIYTRAEITNGYIALKNTLKAGEKVRLILPTGEELLEVATATENGFTVASNQTGPVFVYGREVNDFHTVDYEALTTLNISATQELLVQIQALQNKVVDLERENNNLKAEVQSIEDVKRDLDELKQLIYNSSANSATATMELSK